MASMTNYAENKIVDWLHRGVAVTPPATWYVGIFVATAGQSPRSTAVTLGQTTYPATPNGRLYRCTTAGTTGSSEPTWSTTSGGTTTDGTAVWTEMTPDFEANTNLTEPSGNGYARGSLTSSTTNWAATDAAGSTAATSGGTNGTTSNNSTINLGSPTGPWPTTGAKPAAFFGLFDASTSGNLWFYGALAIARTVTDSGTPISFAAGAITNQIDN